MNIGVDPKTQTNEIQKMLKDVDLA
jgi:ATP-binding cassette, subfamily A (ABC1), member 3